MSENQVPATTPLSHSDTAQARIEELRAMRQQIPNFVFPASPRARRTLSNAASVSPQFIELTVKAVKNSVSLVRGGGLQESERRDLASFADAYEVLAGELEALAQFVRHSVIAARNKIGSDALLTYALAQRLAKRAETADLAPLVRELRDALGRRRKSKAQPDTTPVPEPPVPATAKK